MAQRYFNWTLAIVLVVGVVVLAVAALSLHKWQRSVLAEESLPLGEQAFAAGDWEEAARQIGRYLVINGNDISRLLMYGEAQLKIRPSASDNIQQAISAYSSVLRLDSGHTEAARRLIEIYLGLSAADRSIGRSPGEAELKARRFLEAHDDPVVRRFLALALIQQRNLAEAQKTLLELVAEHPDHVPAYEILGMLAAESPEDANKPSNYWFEEAVSRNPESAWAHILRGGFLRRSGDLPNAMADFERAASLDLSDTRAHLRMIAELIQARAYDEAREQIAALRAKEPTETDLWRYWAAVALQSGSEQEMETVARDGLKELAAYPWDFMPWAGELLVRAKRFEEAADCIRQMQMKNVHPGRCAFLEGYLAQQKDQLPEATAFWRKAIALGYQSRQDPLWRGHPPLVRMSLASILRQRGDLPSAIEQLRLLASDMPGYPQVNLALAQLLSVTEDWPGVLEQARQVQRFIPDQREAVLLELQARMRILAGQGDSAATRNAWRDIEARLAELGGAAGDAGQVRLLEAQTALFQGRSGEAATLLDQLRTDPIVGLRAVLLRAQLYADEGNGTQAVSLLRETMQRFPQNVEPVRQLALLLNRQGDRPACEAAVKDALATVQGANRRSLSMLLAELYASWGQNERLYEWLTELAAQFPDDVEPRRRLLALERVIGDPVKAQTIVDQIKAIEGQSGWQWRVEQARIWILSEDFPNYYSQIVRLLQENLLASPDDRASRLLLAAAHEKAGELQLALAMYRESLQRWPDDVGVITRMVQTLYKVGDDEGAQRMLDRAQSRDLYDPDIQKLRLHGHLRRALAADSDARRDALASASDILRELVRQDPNDTLAGLRLVSTLAAQKKYEEAQGVLDAVKARDPESVSVVVAQIQLDVERGDAEAAFRLCDETIARRDDVFGRMLRGTTYMAFKRYDEAQADFDRMVALEPQKAEVWLVRSDFFRRMGRLDVAVSNIEKALELEPDSLPVQRRALTLFLDSQDAALLERAEVLLDKALQSNPGDVELKLSRAQLLLRRETAPATAQARRVLREVAAESPKLPMAWVLLCTLELREDELGEAMDAALQGLAHNPDNRQLLLLKARAEGRRSAMLAVPTLRGLVDRDPNDTNVVSQLANAYVRSDRPQEAIRVLRQHVAALKDPARKQGEVALASVLYQAGQADEAAAIFRRLVQAEPDNAALVLTWARSLVSQQRWAEAKAVIADWRAAHPSDLVVSATFARDLVAGAEKPGLEVAEELLRADLQSHPRSAGLLHLLANVTATTGRPEEAIALNRRIIEMDPNDVFALNSLAWLLCEEQSQCAKALELANRGLKMRPEYIDLIDTRGVIHHRMGHLDKALEDLTRCVELYPGNAPAKASTHFHLARVYAEMGRRADAIRHVQQALALHRQSRQTTDPAQRKSVLSEKDLADAERLLDQLQKGVG